MMKQVITVSIAAGILTGCGGGGSSLSDSATGRDGGRVNANVAPTANAGADQVISENSTATLHCNGHDTDGTIVGYRWLDGITPVATTQAYTTPALSEGNYTYTCEVTDSDGAVGRDEVVVMSNSDKDNDFIPDNHRNTTGYELR